MAYDRYHNRLGYGKGYYDRFLEDYLKKKRNIITIGLAFSFQKYKKIPTSNHDVNLLLEVLKRLRDNGNTVAVIEHNMEVIKCSDWIIDLGPEGGAEGGEIIAQGTPEDLSKIKRSYTGKFLIDVLKK